MAYVDRRTLAHRWWVLVGCAAIGAGVGAALDAPADNELRGATYSASVTLVPEPTAQPDRQRLELAARLADRLDVARLAAERLHVSTDPGELAAPVDARADRTIGAVVVSARSEDQDAAVRTAQAFGDAAAAYLRDTGVVRLAPAGATLVTRRGDLHIPPTRAGHATAGGVVGLAAGILLALAVPDRRNLRLRHRRDVEAAYGLPVLAEIPRLHGSVRHPGDIAVTARPNGPVAEAYRTLRSAVRQHGPIGSDLRGAAAVLAPTVRVIAVTSPRPGDGRSSVVANLAGALAEAGRQVLVVDCDFAHPTAHLYLGGPPFRPGIGLADLLFSPTVGADLRACVSSTVVPGVSLLTIGSHGRHPAGLMLGMSGVLEEALSHADVVLLDSGPVLASSDAVDLAQYADLVVIAARPGRTTADRARRTRAVLTAAGVDIRGVVLIGARGNPDSAAGYTSGLTLRTPTVAAPLAPAPPDPTPPDPAPLAPTPPDPPPSDPAPSDPAPSDPAPSDPPVPDVAPYDPPRHDTAPLTSDPSPHAPPAPGPPAPPPPVPAPPPPPAPAPAMAASASPAASPAGPPPAPPPAPDQAVAAEGAAAPEAPAVERVDAPGAADRG
jgi:Mrp family chromosome partitioning ATPase